MTKPHNRKRNIMPIAYKSVDISNLKLAPGSRTISGYAAIFGNVDDAREMFIKGAFAKSIAERGPDSQTNRKIAFLKQHEVDEPLGRITVLKEDDKGLYFECELDEIQEAEDVLTQLKSGTLNQFSVGFSYVWDSNKMVYDDNLDAMILKEVKLWEISVVTFGCNEMTEFTGMKSGHKNPQAEAAHLLKQFEDFISDMNETKQNRLRIFVKKLIEADRTLGTEPVPPLGNPKQPQEPKDEFEAFKDLKL